MKELTLSLMMSISNFCYKIAVEKADCVNEVVQCYTNDIYTVNQCKTEYLTDKYGVDYVESN